MIQQMYHFLYGHIMNNNFEKLELIKKHLYMEMEEKGELSGIKEFRKHLSVMWLNS